MLRNFSEVIGNCKKWMFLFLGKAKVIHMCSTNYGLPLPWKRCLISLLTIFSALWCRGDRRISNIGNLFAIIDSRKRTLCTLEGTVRDGESPIFRNQWFLPDDSTNTVMILFRALLPVTSREGTHPAYFCFEKQPDVQHKKNNNSNSNNDSVSV